MNLYVLVEGEKAAKSVYTAWIKYENSNLNPVDYISDIKENNYIVVAGFGQPNIWNHFQNAITDVNNAANINRLVLIIDAEEKTFEEKRSEARSYIDKVKCKADIYLVIQDFCLETWLLGNKSIFRKKSTEPELQKYLSHFDIRQNDPELLPDYPPKKLNRANFAYYYLRAGIKDLYTNRKFYNKHNAGIALENGFYYQVKHTHINYGYLSSFKEFLVAVNE